ncbi:MAG: hypothetical protein ACR5K4_01215 [Sodalis sp. (in: enterobacteria)]
MKADFMAKVDKLLENAFDDQYTNVNLLCPLITNLKQILLDTYYGYKFI